MKIFTFFVISVSEIVIFISTGKFGGFAAKPI